MINHQNRIIILGCKINLFFGVYLCYLSLRGTCICEWIVCPNLNLIAILSF